VAGLTQDILRAVDTATPQQLVAFSAKIGAARDREQIGRALIAAAKARDPKRDKVAIVRLVALARVALEWDAHTPPPERKLPSSAPPPRTEASRGRAASISKGRSRPTR
jgi:hypothetical protein